MSPDTLVLIEFDGGTPCNVRARGYGIGYGSYRINGGGVVRCDHERPMSANAAEILTLVCAVRRVVELHGRQVEGKSTRLHIRGDSQIALKWARGATESGKPAKQGKGGSEEFRNAIQTLRDVLKGFAVTAEWQPRAKSVEAFGH